MNQQGNVIFYTTPKNQVRVEVHFEDETFWLTQKRMAELFGVQVPAIAKHLKNIFAEGELLENSVISILETTAADGKRYQTQLYNLDAIIAVGYRVNSAEATQFRIWATQVLKEYIIKGFVLDDERLKNGKQFGKDYFAELLERIREIRASERRFYQKITDIYSQCSIDYDAKAEITQTFFKTVQNKLHFAITGMTAAEIIRSRADSDKPGMGLKTWKNSPDGKILRTDVTIAKNYLDEKELRNLNRIVTMYLDFAEVRAEREIPMKMKDWVDKLDAFLQFNGYELLHDAGRVRKAVADKLALEQYEKYRIGQDRAYESDFDRMVKQLESKQSD
ncbi:MAG: cell filamentation protein Fic [Thiothrix lacustris]|uniref:Cell filamentation protein Fic n=1 Tax=Thiothrix lacustris TaxID=525917 RepID=A0A1Y1QGI5_9GAMM|nr:MAG: cell filamentation protein Fic [Thiothrix lacustris]